MGSGARRVLGAAVLLLAGLVALLLPRLSGVGPTADVGGPVDPTSSTAVEGSAATAPAKTVGSAAAARPPADVLDARVRVLGSDGLPLRARVRVARSKDFFKTFEQEELETGPSGELSISSPSSSWVLLSAQSEGYSGRLLGPLAWGEEASAGLKLALEPAPAVVGSSVWNDGKVLSHVRLSFAPDFPPGEFSAIQASKLGLVDEVIVTDSNGRFTCRSLRPGQYRVSFPEHPTWKPLVLQSRPTEKGTISLKIPWTPR